ncbi:MAG TPA: hypothetical protein VGH19_00495 [Verrucomicrobiae bacterium]
MSQDQGTRPARYAYGVWFILALTGAWAYHALTPFILRAALGLMGDIEILPNIFRHYLRLQPWLWSIPLLFLIFGLLCKHITFLRHPVSISVSGGLLCALYLFIGICLASPYFIHAYSPPFPGTLKKQLREADELTLYALWTTNAQTALQEKFHDYPITGKVELKNHPRRQTTIEGLIQGSETNSTEMVCFYPHHGLRAVHQGKTIDLLICFGCGKVEHHPSGKFYHMHKSTQPVLDSIFVDAGVPLPPEKKTKPEAEKTE